MYCGGGDGCEEEGEGGHHGARAAPRVPGVAVVRVAPGEGRCKMYLELTGHQVMSFVVPATS